MSVSLLVQIFMVDRRILLEVLKRQICGQQSNLLLRQRSLQPLAEAPDASRQVLLHVLKPQDGQIRVRLTPQSFLHQNKVNVNFYAYHVFALKNRRTARWCQ